MGSYQKNFSDFAVTAIDMLAEKTLKAQDLSSIVDSTANGPASQTAIAYASGGSYGESPTGGAARSAQYGGFATFAITTDVAGAVSAVKVIEQGPNIADVGDTIIFLADALNAAFGVSNITGDVTATIAGADLEVPSGIFRDRLPSLYVGSAGNVKVTLANDSLNGFDPTVLTGLQAGTFVPVACRRIYNTDAATTVTNLLALF
jgi:hypothetical protein